MKTRTAILVLCILGLVGCTAQPPQVSVPTLPPLADSTPGNLNVNFYIDATESMEGFASRALQVTGYQDLLKTLEDTVPILNSTPQVDKYRFGSRGQVSAVTGLLNVSAGQDKAFYDITKVGSKTEIDALLLNQVNKCLTNKPDNLTVIVSDLFQTDGAIAPLIKALQKCYLDQDLVVGLVGVESAFDGIIYDATPGGGGIKAKGNRPVYALVLGNYLNVAKYFESLKLTSPRLSKNGRFSLFAQRVFTEPPAFWVELPKDHAGNLIPQGLLSNIYWFELNEPKPIDFSACAALPKKRNPDLAVFELSKGEFTTQVRRFALDGNGEKKLTQPIVNISKAKDCEFGLTVQVDTARLTDSTDPNGHYLIETGFQPSAFGYPNKWDAWNTDDPIRQPTKTLNLTRFLKSLYGAALTTATPEVGLAFFVTKK